MSIKTSPTPEQLDNFLVKYRYGEDILLPYDDFVVSVKTALTETEKKTFVNRVLENAYPSNIEFSSIDANIVLLTTFAQMLTDLPIPVKEEDPDVVDVNKLCSIIDGLQLLINAKALSKQFSDLYDELLGYIYKEIEFRNQKIVALYGASNATEEAVETFSFAMNKLVDLMNVAIKQLEKNGNKLFKNLTPKRIEEFVNKIQNSLMGQIQSNNDVADGKVFNFKDKN